jgi:hypothetical protein
MMIDFFESIGSFLFRIRAVFLILYYQGRKNYLISQYLNIPKIFENYILIILARISEFWLLYNLSNFIIYQIPSFKLFLSCILYFAKRIADSMTILRISIRNSMERWLNNILKWYCGCNLIADTLIGSC